MLKTITFAVMHFCVAFTVAYLITGSIVMGGAVALVEPAINTVAFYFHEKIWNTYDVPKFFCSIKYGMAFKGDGSGCWSVSIPKA